MQEPHLSCALRALTLCDTTEVETPEHTMQACLCELQRRAEKADEVPLMMRAALRRDELLVRLFR